jgi:menaquinone-dependent protoporphyrinogen oxidase
MAVASNIPEEHEEAEKISKDFLEQTGWQTSTVWQIAGALRYTQYDYFKKLIMRIIAKKQGGATDTGKDHEYTDWEKTKKTILGFINDIG